MNAIKLKFDEEHKYSILNDSDEVLAKELSHEEIVQSIILKEFWEFIKKAIEVSMEFPGGWEINGNVQYKRKEFERFNAFSDLLSEPERIALLIKEFEKVNDLYNLDLDIFHYDPNKEVVE